MPRMRKRKMSEIWVIWLFCAYDCHYCAERGDAVLREMSPPLNSPSHFTLNPRICYVICYDVFSVTNRSLRLFVVFISRSALVFFRQRDEETDGFYS